MEETKPLNLWVMSAEYDPYIIGGLGIVATYLTEEYANLGMQVTVITTRPRVFASIVRGERITLVRFPKNYNISLIPGFMARNDFSVPDVIHIHSLQYVDLLAYYKRASKIPAIYTCHSLVPRKASSEIFTPRRQAHLLRSVDKVVVPSKSEYKKLLRRYRFCRKKTAIIAHGVRSNGTNTNRASKYHLVYVGRLVHKKGIEELIDAMAVLRTKHPQARLSIIGSGKNSFVRQLKQRADKNRVSRIVHWRGSYGHRKLQAAYGRFGAVVMPSRTESFGLVALEALANGVPLIATRAGGLRHFVTNEVAQVIPRVSGGSIAKAIAKMWKSPQKTEERVRAGKKTAQQYEWSQAAVKYAKVLASVRRAK